MKWTIFSFLALAIVFASGAILNKKVDVRDAPIIEAGQERIVGGEITDISLYPFAVSMLYDQQDWIPHTQWCGGSILTTTAILSAAHCYDSRGSLHETRWWKARVGSTFANSGGSVHDVSHFVMHPEFDWWYYNHDIAIVRLASAITYIPSVVQAGSIAGSAYPIPDNLPVTLIGWGATFSWGPVSESLRHVQVETVNQEECVKRYATVNPVTDGMLCAGLLDVGGKDQCSQDSGGPVLHNGVIVGVCSWGSGCADKNFPGVNARVSTYSNWIVASVNN